jgi:serine/threonine protein kinase
MPSQTKIKLGRYEVVSVLGQGAMGTVYKAVDPLIERAVAIKTINLKLSKEERVEFEARFYREAKSAGRLNHAGIVTIYDVGENDEIAYIAMEFLEGESLREMLDSGVVLPIELIRKIAVRVAGALHFAHENEVVHRDIKPANIMIMPSHDIKIMDFGIAQIPTGSRTQLGTVLGSPKYMAPEQVTGEPTDRRTDIFALGVVLYEMLTGMAPFNGDNLSTIMYRILNEAPIPPSTINARVPPVLDRIVGKALAKRPEDRYQTALEFAKDLDKLDAVFPHEARRPDAGTAPTSVVPASRPPRGQLDDATLFLPPHKAQELIAIPRSGKGHRIRKEIARLLGKARRHPKPVMLAVSILLVAAFVIYPQGPRPIGDKDAAAEARPLEAIASGMSQPVAPPEKLASAVLEAPMASSGSGVPAPESARPPTAKPPPPAKQIAVPAAIPKLASSPEVHASASAAAPASRTQARANITFAIAPWGEVHVDGKRVGVSPPLAALQLDAGKHKVEIRNQASAPYRATVDLKPGQSLKIRHKFK